MECPSCGGDAGCSECNETGRLQIESCPLELVTPDVWEVVELAEFYEKGLPPVAGGVLDQAAAFIEAAAIVFREKAYWKKYWKSKGSDVE
jgi:hypothetical protein